MEGKSFVPDVLLQSHSAPLALAFYEGKQFPAEYRGDVFATSHGSWNRSHRTGYKVVRIFTPNGKATGEYEDFVTGFVVDDANVWGRPVGVTVASDGSLVFTDDGSNSIWRVSYVGSKRPQVGILPNSARPGRMTSRHLCSARADAFLAHSTFNFRLVFPIITVSLCRLEPRVSRSRSAHSRRPHHAYSPAL